MKGPCSRDWVKMAVMYFLSSIILGPKKTAEYVLTVESSRFVRNIFLGMFWIREEFEWCVDITQITLGVTFALSNNRFSCST